MKTKPFNPLDYFTPAVTAYYIADMIEEFKPDEAEEMTPQEMRTAQTIQKMLAAEVRNFAKLCEKK